MTDNTSEIEEAISKYLRVITEEYDLDLSELTSKWEEIKSECITEQSPCKNGFCPYQYTRGSKKGTVCGAKLRGDNTHCSKHRPSEKPKSKGLVFRRHRKYTNLLWNPSTGFAMRDKSEGIIAKICERREGESKVDTSLTDEDISNCKKLNLPYKRISKADAIDIIN